MDAVNDILASVLDSTLEARKQDTSIVEKFCNAFELQDQLRAFLELDPEHKPQNKLELVFALDRWIATVDETLNRQVNAVIHHPRFQKIEASWSGLQYLIDQVDEVSRVKVRVLNISWRELIKDFERAIDFDQSQIFRKVYNDEFGTSGGQPFGVLLGDYEVRHRVNDSYNLDDIIALREMSQVAAASFAPFIVGASPELFGLDRFSELGSQLDFEAIFGQAEYVKWNSFREMSDSRFVGVSAPKVLMRLPYTQNNFRCDGFVFHEEVSTPDGSAYLWGNACYAYGAVLVRAFEDSGWFTDICGGGSNVDGGGVVFNLPGDKFLTDPKSAMTKITTDVLITDELEKSMSDIGFMPLCHSKGTKFAVFQSNLSVHRAPVFNDLAATINARMSAMLHYMLCTSRFAHYIKIMSREKIGSFSSADDVQKYISNWLKKYTMNTSEASWKMRAKHPLAEGRAEVKDVIGKSGAYSCVIYLKPHMQYDQMESSVKLVTELTESRV